MSINQEIQKEKYYYRALQERIKKSLVTAPEGNLRISNSRGNSQFYCYTNPKDTSGKYIRKKETTLIRALAQKDYDRKVLDKVEEYLTQLDKLEKIANEVDIKSEYEELHEARKKFVVPYEISDEEYIKQWKSVSYKGKEFSDCSAEIMTENGERVRSKSEKIIADKLKYMGIPYRYEYPVYLFGYGTVYPDFTLLNVTSRREYFLEYFGMSDNPEYAEKMVKKMNTYMQNGIFPGKQLLILFETQKQTIQMRVVEKMFEEYLLN